jgi:chromosome segregation ATPase
MSGALVRYVAEPRIKGGYEQVNLAADVEEHIASLKREHEQQLAALQAEREDAQASFQHALKYSGECNTKLAALEADRDRLLAENKELRGDLNIMQLQRDAKLCSMCPRSTVLADALMDRDRLRAALATLQEEVVGLCLEIEWYASRKVNLAGICSSATNSKVETWADMLTSDVAELRKATVQAGAALSPDNTKE